MAVELDNDTEDLKKWASFHEASEGGGLNRDQTEANIRANPSPEIIDLMAEQDDQCDDDENEWGKMIGQKITDLTGLELAANLGRAIDRSDDKEERQECRDAVYEVDRAVDDAVREAKHVVRPEPPAGAFKDVMPDNLENDPVDIKRWAEFYNDGTLNVSETRSNIRNNPTEEMQDLGEAEAEACEDVHVFDRPGTGYRAALLTVTLGSDLGRNLGWEFDKAAFHAERENCFEAGSNHRAAIERAVEEVTGSVAGEPTKSAANVENAPVSSPVKPG